MADEPIDCSGSHYVSARCVGCGTHVVAVPEQIDQARCLDCRRTHEQITVPWFTPYGKWHPTVGYPAPGSAGAISDGKMTHFGPAEYEIGQKLSHFAPSDPHITLRCVSCGETWPQVLGLDDSGRVRAFADHDRIAHHPNAWLVGGPGGANETICDPCGGGGPEKRPRDGGPDHSKCLKGKKSGWGGRCDCQHRSRAQIDQIVGKTEPGWAPKRWSDPEIVEIAAENVQNRWNQLNLWEEGSHDESGGN